jgi:hypothetical protein
MLGAGVALGSAATGAAGSGDSVAAVGAHEANRRANRTRLGKRRFFIIKSFLNVMYKSVYGTESLPNN